MCSGRRPPRTGCACWRLSTNRTAAAWFGRRRPRCSSARPPESLAAGGEALTDRVANTLREWADHARERGIAAVFEAAQLAGMARRVLQTHGGERHMTDLAHLTQLLHETAHREHYTLPALRDWLRTQCTERAASAGREGERNRRLDSDATAVQIMTVWVSKGLQYPVVYLPYAFNNNVQSREMVLYHEDTTRCLHIGGPQSADYPAVQALGQTEAANDHIRLTYVALTRAQSQVVAWWAPAWDEPNGGLSRLLRGRGIGDRDVPGRCSPATIIFVAGARVSRFRPWNIEITPRAFP